MYLGRSFFAADPVTVARALVGAVLEVTAPGSRRAAGRIVEVEAYGGPEDAASHAAAGPTPRSAIMFGPPGVAYVYFIYGMHHCLNVVTGPSGMAGAVLIRAIEPTHDRNGMAVRRGLDPMRCRDRDLGGGPGRVCQSLGIDLDWNGLPVTGGTRIMDNAAGRLRLVAATAPPRRLVSSGRIGVRRAAEVPWRFCDADSPCLSRSPG